MISNIWEYFILWRNNANDYNELISSDYKYDVFFFCYILLFFVYTNACYILSFIVFFGKRGRVILNVKRNVKSQVLESLQEARKNGMFTGVLLTASLFVLLLYSRCCHCLGCISGYFKLPKNVPVCWQSLPVESTPKVFLLWCCMALAAKTNWEFYARLWHFYFGSRSLYFRSTVTRAMFNRIMDYSLICSLASLLVALIQKWMHYAQNPESGRFSTFLTANGINGSYYNLCGFDCHLPDLFPKKQNRPFYLCCNWGKSFRLYLSGKYVFCRGAVCCGIMTILLLKEQYKYVIIFIVMVIGGIYHGDAPKFFPAYWNTGSCVWAAWRYLGNPIRGILQGDPLIGEGDELQPDLWTVWRLIKPSYHAHNLYLDMLLNYGILALRWLCFIGLRRAESCGTGFAALLPEYEHIAGFGMLFTIMVHGCTDVTIFWIQTAICFCWSFLSVGIQPLACRRLVCRALPLQQPGLLKLFILRIQKLRPWSGEPTHGFPAFFCACFNKENHFLHTMVYRKRKAEKKARDFDYGPVCFSLFP